ncbi:hypothetical protein IPH19_04160 [Candidatus Uhrbacteria bacterium]|nr:MAG: hypothetical protein IPH19_04160 [Candidatus Uhrbacteria bacterium]
MSSDHVLSIRFDEPGPRSFSFKMHGIRLLVRTEGEAILIETNAASVEHQEGELRSMLTLRGVKIVPEVAATQPSEGMKIILDRLVGTIKPSTRAANALQNNGIKYIGQLVQLTGRDLTRMKNFGATSVGELERKLSQLGLRFGMKLDGWTEPTGYTDAQKSLFNLPLASLELSEKTQKKLKKAELSTVIQVIETCKLKRSELDYATYLDLASALNKLGIDLWNLPD